VNEPLAPPFDWVAVIRVQSQRLWTVISVMLELAQEDAFYEGEALDRNGYCFFGRVRASSGGRVVERWCGSQQGMVEDPIVDDFPRFPRLGVEVSASDDLELTIDFRITYLALDGAVVAAGELTSTIAMARPFPEELRVGLVAHTGDGASGLRGPPFDEPVVVEQLAVSGPPLPGPPLSAGQTWDPISDPTALASLPDVGVVGHHRASGMMLITREGVQPLPMFPSIHQLFGLSGRALTAGVGGMLAVVWVLDSYSDSDTSATRPRLSIFGPPGLTLRHALTEGPKHVFSETESRIDPTGRFLILSIGYGRIAALDLARGAFVWHRKWYALLYDLALDVSSTTVVLAGEGELRELDLASGDERRRAWVPEPPAESAIGVCAALSRFAWTQMLAVTPVPRGAVAWHDPDGRGGQVAVPDAFEDPRLVVLPDGRIVATGESTWLVDPDHTGRPPERIAPRLMLPKLPIVTATESGYRLWTLDPARWYVELPARRVSELAP